LLKITFKINQENKKKKINFGCDGWCV
jgi:hypothetical protein